MASQSKGQRTRKKQTRIKKIDPVANPGEESPYGELIKLINFEETPATEESIELLLTRPPVHKPEAGINPLVDAAAYVFSSMGQLARMRNRHDLAELHKKLVDEIREFQNAVEALNYQQEYLAEYIPIATYSLATTLNDIVANTSWGGQGKWDEYCLLKAFHQETLSRDNFLIILERFVQDQNIFIDLMEFIYISLNLGFKYSCHSSGFGAEQLQRIMHSLYKRIRIYRGNFNKMLFPYPLKMNTVDIVPIKSESKIARYLKGNLSRKTNVMLPALTEQAEASQNRFASFMDFLDSRSVTIKNKKIQLNALPWLFVIGLPDSGKTALIENSKVKFIMGKSNIPGETINPEDKWNWWITPSAVIFDIPGSFIHNNNENSLAGQHWKDLLDLVLKNRGTSGISAVTVVISYTEIMDKYLHPTLIAKLGESIANLQNRFGKNLPINLIINKCDLIPGFSEYFDDFTSDELSQPWGMRLSFPAEDHSINDIFNEKFDVLIKQLNNQLIYRLHQEKDFRYQEKFRIKDFPLQLEQVKENLGEIIKGFINDNVHFTLHGVFLACGMQSSQHEQEAQLPQVFAGEELLQSLTIMAAPTAPAQSCFIKQLLASGLAPGIPDSATAVFKQNWLNFLYKQVRGI